MRSYTESVALLQKMAKVPTTDTTNTALLTGFWNDSIRTMANIRGGKWKFLETTKTVSTVAAQSGYAIPASLRKVMGVMVTVSGTDYTPMPVFDSDAWNSILASDLADSDTPMYYYIQNRTLYLQPAPATSSNTITIRGRENIVDQSVADASVTVTAVAAGGTAVTVSAGALASMAGKYIRIPASTTGVANTGDNRWYKIASATPTTTITLETPYEGTAIVAGTVASTVAQIPPIPEAYDMGPIFRTLAIYNTINDPLHPEVARTYWRLYDGGQEAGLSQMPGGLVGQMLENEAETVEGVFVGQAVTNIDPNYPPEDLTGF